MNEFISLIPLWALNWIIFPILIVVARICDVSLGTMRIILVSKGHRNIAPIVGFMEVFIWIVVISHIIQHLDQVQYYFAYAFGYALGTFLGMKIESRLSLGQVLIRIITNHDISNLINNLKERNVNFTISDALGKFGPVKIIFIITQRHLLRGTIKIIETSDYSVFYSIEDVRHVKGILPGGKNHILSSLNPFSKPV